MNCHTSHSVTGVTAVAPCRWEADRLSCSPAVTSPAQKEG